MWYNVLVVRTDTLDKGGGDRMDLLLTFLVTVAAGVVCHLIGKWLDRHDKDN